MIFRVGLFVRIKYTYLIEHVDIERVDDVAENIALELGVDCNTHILQDNILQ